MPLLGTFAGASARGTGRGASFLRPNVPTNFSATGVSADDNAGGAAIIFTPPDTAGGSRPVTGYQVENTSTGIITAIAGSGATVPLPKNTTQSFRMRAIGPGGNGDWTSSDNALSFRQEYGGENGYYTSSNRQVSVPNGTTVGYYLVSGYGQYSKGDTRTYQTSTRYRVYLWYNNYSDWWTGNDFYSPWGQWGNGDIYNGGSAEYASRSIGNYTWYALDSQGNYLTGYYSYAGFYGHPGDEYWYGYSYNSSPAMGYGPNTHVHSMYTSGTFSQTIQTGGSDARGPDYGNYTRIYNSTGASNQINATSLGYNGTPSTTSGSFTVSGSNSVYLQMGEVNYNYSVETPAGPSGRARIWYGT